MTQFEDSGQIEYELGGGRGESHQQLFTSEPQLMDHVEENEPISHREGMMFAKAQEDSENQMKQYIQQQRSGSTQDGEFDDQEYEEPYQNEA